MTLLDKLRAYMRARLIPDVAAWWRLWSMRLILLGVAWESIPPELLAFLPFAIPHWVTVVILAAAAVARIVQQQPQETTHGDIR